jgi:transposase
MESADVNYRRNANVKGNCIKHLVENAFTEIKRWRGIATHYAKNAASCLVAVHIRCIIVWVKIY